MQENTYMNIYRHTFSFLSVYDIFTIYGGYREGSDWRIALLTTYRT
jgi:hypothetical protein